MTGCVYVCMYVCINVCMSICVCAICMCICVCIFVCTYTISMTYSPTCFVTLWQHHWPKKDTLILHNLIITLMRVYHIILLCHSLRTICIIFNHWAFVSFQMSHRPPPFNTSQSDHNINESLPYYFLCHSLQTICIIFNHSFQMSHRPPPVQMLLWGLQ